MTSAPAAADARPTPASPAALPETVVPPAQFTIITNDHGPLTKRLSLAADGSLTKSPACLMYEGGTQRRYVQDLGVLATIITDLETSQALCYGTATQEVAKLVTKAKLAQNPGAIARDGKHFSFPVGPGIMMFDYDPGDAPLPRDEVIAQLRRALPEFADVSLLWRPSASSCIYNSTTGEKLQGVLGQRIWAIVSDASKIPDIAKALAIRLWALGYATHRISKSGQLLDRPLFDMSVYQPERLDYCAGAIFDEPLEQRLPPPAVIPGARDWFDCGALPVITPTEKAAAASRRNADYEEQKAPARSIKSQWVKQRAADLTARRGVSAGVATSAMRRAVNHGELDSDFILISENHGEVTVAEVLADPDKFNDTGFADPLEPDYNNDPRIAHLFLDGTPVLHSFAHGGQTYRLLGAPANTAGDGNADDALAKMNKEFAVVQIGKDVLIARRLCDAVTGNTEITFINKTAFSTLTQNRPHPGGGKKANLGGWWMANRGRHEFRAIEFNPAYTKMGHLNLFQAFPIYPHQGKSVLFWEFVRDIICAGDADSYAYLRRWLAHLFQRPDELPEVAIVLRSSQGTGKNTFADAIGHLVGQHYVALNSMDQVTGRFNGHTSQALLVFANEAIWGGTKAQAGTLKAMITDKQIPIEKKGVDIVMIDNFRRLIVASNERWAVPVDPDDRRFVFLDVSTARVGDRAYYKALHDELEDGGYAAIMYDLTSEDISNFNPRERPDTGYGFDAKLQSSEPLIRWLHEVLQSAQFDLAPVFRSS